jgi:outer membrane lipoprotein carrier protein
MAAALPNRGSTMRRVALLSTAAIILLIGGPAAARQQSAQQVAVALQAKYDGIRDFSADFTQQYESGVLRRKITERGKVQVKKPGKMRWDYTEPEKKLFVSDGSRIYLWVPADNQVTMSAVPTQDEATTAVLFLVGKGNLARDFNVSFAEGAAAGTHALRLDPKLPERDYDWLRIVVDQRTMQIRSLTAADRQGGQSTFHLSNFKENVGIPDSTFAFKVPKGADVITADGSKR